MNSNIKYVLMNVVMAFKQIEQPQDDDILLGYAEGRHRQVDMVMVMVMASLIVYGDITFQQVPARSQNAVRSRLEIWGFDENGQPLEPEQAV